MATDLSNKLCGECNAGQASPPHEESKNCGPESRTVILTSGETLAVPLSIILRLGTIVTAMKHVKPAENHVVHISSPLVTVNLLRLIIDIHTVCDSTGFSLELEHHNQHAIAIPDELKSMLLPEASVACLQKLLVLIECASYLQDQNTEFICTEIFRHHILMHSLEEHFSICCKNQPLFSIDDITSAATAYGPVFRNVTLPSSMVLQS